MVSTPTVIVADDHPLFSSALSQAVNNSLDPVNIETAFDIASLQSCVEKQPLTELILLDLQMPGAHGFSGLIYLSANHPEIPVIVVSAHASSHIIRRAMDHGASGYLPKSSSIQEITDAIGQVLAGNLWLPSSYDTNTEANISEEMNIADTLSTFTPQQFRVATILAQGLPNKQIAYELNVTEATIKAHITEIFRKLGVHSRTEAVLTIRKLDVLPSGDNQL